jgi:16S rRNA (cytidine1402-2'-O)-methyltransferase
VAVCRELTKRFEEVVRGTADELAARFREAARGEVTLVVAPAARSRVSTGARSGVEADVAIDAVRRLVAAGAARRVAVDVVAGVARTPRNELYRASLEQPD